MCRTCQSSLHPNSAIPGPACSRHAQDEASQSLSMAGEGAQEVPPLAEELLVADGYWERRSQFSTGLSALKAHDPILMYIQEALNRFRIY